MMPRFVVTGTDTGIGKTVFSAALAAALDAAYWKPVQAGMDEETDSEIVGRLGEIPPARILPEAYKLKTPASPHLSARIDKMEIDPDRLTLPEAEGALVIEGAGGLLVPLTDNQVFADVFARWRLPVILCARTALGTINHTLLSIEALRSRSIPLFGVAFIGNEEVETQRIIGAMGNVRILGRLPRLDPVSPTNLRKAFRDQFSLSSFLERAA